MQNKLKLSFKTKKIKYGTSKVITRTTSKTSIP
jgi:hypothetical protein